MRISSREWQGDRRFDGVLFALLAHGVAVVALGVVTGQHRTRVEHAQRVTLPERAEHLRFVAPAVEAPVPRTIAHSHPHSRRPLIPGPPPETPAPVRDTGAAIATSPGVLSPPAAVAAVSLLASPLLADRRLLVGPAAASGVADVRVRDANASIALRVRAVADSAYRKALGWTVGDSTHRYGIAPCGIRVSKICIPFGIGNMPRPSFSGVDRNRGDDAAFGAAVDSVRARSSRP